MGKKVELIFHIGTGKTGTTAVQNTLHQNRQLLRRAFNILYPDMEEPSLFKPKKIRTNHCYYFGQKIKSDNKREGVQSFKQDVQKLIEKSAAEGVSKIIFSCERLFASNEFPVLLSEALSTVDAKIRLLLYLRRQDLLAESAWKQWGTKNPKFSSIQEYIRSPEADKILDYQRYMDQWVHFFGKDQIELHTFERSCIGDNIITHVLKQVPLTDAQIEQVKYPPIRQANVGYSKDVVWLLRLYKQADIHDNTLHHLLNKALPPSHLKSDPFKPYGLLDIGQRQKIMARYREGNKAIARLFFAQEERDKLFLEPLDTGSLDTETLERGTLLTETSQDSPRKSVKIASDQPFIEEQPGTESAIPILLDLLIHQEKRLRRIESRYRKLFNALPLPSRLKKMFRRYLKSL